MTTFRKVALLGRGNLGSKVLDELLKAKYTVTVLTRSDPDECDVPAGASIKQVDYTSPSQLEAALSGHDIVISTITPEAIPLQKPIIDAAIAVGVKRFIPAEFGAMTSDPKGKELPFHKDAVDIQIYLKGKTDEGKIEYTIFAVGVFMELLFTMPLAVDFGMKAVRLFDGGIHPFSTSRLSTVAKAVVSSLQKPVETRNRLVRVHDIVLTPRQIADMAKKWAPDHEWTEEHLDAKAELEDLLVKVGDDFVPALVPKLFLVALFSGEFGAAYGEVDNALLGIEKMGLEEVEEFGRGLVSSYCRGY